MADKDMADKQETTIVVGVLTFVRIVAWCLCGAVVIISWIALTQASRAPGQSGYNVNDILMAIYFTGIGFVAARSLDGIAGALIDRM